MLNIRIINNTANQELWYSQGEFIQNRDDADEYEALSIAIHIAEAISAGICFIGSEISEEEKIANPQAYDFEQIQVLDGPEIKGVVDIYEE